MNTPDNWIILKIKEDTGYFYKILCGWSGGYLDGDSWKMNSGIKDIITTEHYYDFIGESGSVYRCHKGGERISGAFAHVLGNLTDKHPDVVTHISLDQLMKEFGNEEV